jgi:hypothetical protein
MSTSGTDPASEFGCVPALAAADSVSPGPSTLSRVCWPTVERSRPIAMLATIRWRPSTRPVSATTRGQECRRRKQ